MAIRYQYGTKAVLQAAKVAGRATAAREQAQRTMQQYDRGEQTQLALLRMRNDKELAQFRVQMELVTRQRAHLFELERVETTARINAARDEKKRIQFLDELDQGLKAINEYPYMTENEKQKAALDFRLKKLGGYVAPERMTARQQELQLIDRLMSGQTTQMAGQIPDATKMQSAPDVVLDPYWDKLSNEDKMELWALSQYPAQFNKAIDRLKQKYGEKTTAATTQQGQYVPYMGWMTRTAGADWGVY